MSAQDDVKSPSGQTRTLSIADQRAAALEAKKVQEDAGKARLAKKARMARVLERGYIVDRLTVDLPPELHGEWVPVDQIDRWSALGFMVDKEHAHKRQLHPDGTGGPALPGPARIGDVVFMVCSKEDFEIMQEVKSEIYIKTHGSPKDKKRLLQKEEQEYKNLVEHDIGLAVVDEGKERPVGSGEISSAIRERIAQGPQPAGLTEMGKRE